MAVSTKDPNLTSDRKKWDLIFNGLVSMLQKQQSQLKFLQDKLKLKHDRWISDVNLLKQQRSQMRMNIKLREMDLRYESAKSELFMSVKQTESFMHKLNLEITQSDLEDFKAWFDLLSSKCAEPKEPLESELRRLKYENEKLNSEKTSELSALSKEGAIMWNQFNMLGSNLTDNLRNKQVEYEEANKKMAELLADMEKLQASNTEKDDLIENLKNSIAELESDSLTKTKEISRLSEELESLKKLRSDPVTPELCRCTAEAGRGKLGGKKSIVHNRNVTVRKELNSSEVVKEGSRDSKRRTVESFSMPGPSRLMSSRFKVPKLKSSPYFT